MKKDYEAVCQVTIAAPPPEVWDALTNPEKVRKYMHGTTIASDWQVGSPVTWSGEWQGRAYEDKGTVLEVAPLERLAFTHWSSIGGSEDLPENYHTVSYSLEAVEHGTSLTLRQDNNATQDEADKMAEQNWKPVLEGLKQTVETA